jgi:hypothetical protein
MYLMALHLGKNDDRDGLKLMMRSGLLQIYIRSLSPTSGVGACECGS